LPSVTRRRALGAPETLRPSQSAYRQGYVESLPFADNAFDIVISRYSAHHWHDVGAALREVNRILKPGGRLIVMDVMSPGHPVRDVWLQTV
ncbi:class I SAM-dependent methyltransferase, partial [Escherichia coli]|uniref:class I SAM-dependent methyltransferase n=1 Tax=Escherichia coli TaxID=562 RepID=UPI004067E605